MTEPSTVNGKTRITIRLDTDVLDWFRDEVEAAGGGSYQTMINRALREYMHNREQFSENMLRRVIREELAGLRSAPVTFKSKTTVCCCLQPSINGRYSFDQQLTLGNEMDGKRGII